MTFTHVIVSKSVFLPIICATVLAIPFIKKEGSFRKMYDIKNRLMFKTLLSISFIILHRRNTITANGKRNEVCQNSLWFQIHVALAVFEKIINVTPLIN